MKKTNEVIYHLLDNQPNKNETTNLKNFINIANTNYNHFKQIDKLYIYNLTKEIRIPSQLKYLIVKKCKKDIFNTLVLPSTLEILDLWNCHNLNINDLKSKCPNLKYLHIYNCKLENDNKNIEQLPETLEKIEIITTPIERILIPYKCKSVRFSCIKNLSQLHFEENPNGNETCFLEILEIFNCRIKNLSFLNRCNYLKFLEIKKNSIENIELPQTNNLKLLKLRTCGLKKVPKLPISLEILDLWHNRLGKEQCLNEILKCNNLKYLELSWNKFKGKLDVSHMDNLIKLILYRNNFIEVVYPNSVKQLEINCNNLQKYPEIKPNIKYLDISSNSLELSLEEIDKINNFNMNTTIVNDINSEIDTISFENGENINETQYNSVFYNNLDDSEEQYIFDEYINCNKIERIEINESNLPLGYEYIWNENDILLINKKINYLPK
jgi:hypothetical protein